MVLRLSVLLSGSVLVILLVPVFWFLLSVLRVVLLEMAEGLGLEEVEEGIEDVERDYILDLSSTRCSMPYYTAYVATKSVFTKCIVMSLSTLVGRTTRHTAKPHVCRYCFDLLWG